MYKYLIFVTQNIISSEMTAFLTLYLLMSSADNFCKQFGPSTGPTECRARSGSKLFDTLIKFLKKYFEKSDFEKNQKTTKKVGKSHRGQRVKR